MSGVKFEWCALTCLAAVVSGNPLVLVLGNHDTCEQPTELMSSDVEAAIGGGLKQRWQSDVNSGSSKPDVVTPAAPRQLEQVPDNSQANIEQTTTPLHKYCEDSMVYTGQFHCGGTVECSKSGGAPPAMLPVAPLLRTPSSDHEGQPAVKRPRSATDVRSSPSPPSMGSNPQTPRSTREHKSLLKNASPATLSVADHATWTDGVVWEGGGDDEGLPSEKWSRSDTDVRSSTSPASTVSGSLTKADSCQHFIPASEVEPMVTGIPLQPKDRKSKWRQKHLWIDSFIANSFKCVKQDCACLIVKTGCSLSGAQMFVCKEGHTNAWRMVKALVEGEVQPGTAMRHLPHGIPEGSSGYEKAELKQQWLIVNTWTDAFNRGTYTCPVFGCEKKLHRNGFLQDGVQRFRCGSVKDTWRHFTPASDVKHMVTSGMSTPSTKSHPQHPKHKQDAAQ